MKMSRLLAVLALVVSAPQAFAELLNDVQPKFEQYHVDIYHGVLHPLKGYSKDRDGYWRDSNGKTVDAPEINFAGSYYISAHSCGTGCRYYTMNSMITGEESDVLRMFASTEPPPRTKEGYPFITELVTKADSRMIVARYIIEAGDKQLCRERIFLLDEKNRITPITKTQQTTCRD